MSTQRFLNPIGAIDPATSAPGRASRGASAGKPVIGLLNNSKPNVSYFLEGIAAELERTGEYDIVSVTKPRSAAPAPELAALVDRCRYVINAVAD